MSSECLYPKFKYGWAIDCSNKKFSIKENGVDLEITLLEGSYGFNSFGDMLQSQLNCWANSNYVVTYDRASCKYTITPDTGTIGFNFDSIAPSVFDPTLLGFEKQDYPEQAFWESPVNAGFEYCVQFPAQSLVLEDYNFELTDAAVCRSAKGRVQTAYFSEDSYIEFEIQYASNKIRTNCIRSVFIQNETGVEDLIKFMKFATKKHTLDLMIDKDDPDTFIEVILDRTRQSRNGTAFALQELFAINLPCFFNTGVLRFRRKSKDCV